MSSVPPRAKTQAQIIAENDAHRVFQEVQDYQHALASLPLSRAGGGGICRADGWNERTELLQGEFDLDDPVGQALLKQLIASDPKMRDSLLALHGTPTSTGHQLRAVPQAGPVKAPESNWLEDYLFKSDATGQPGSLEKLLGETRSAGVGPGNILGNTIAAAHGAGLLSAESQTAARLADGAKRIKAGTVRSVRVNEFMELYNANKTGKGRPRLRLRIRGLPLTVVTPSLAGLQWRTTTRMPSASWGGATAGQLRSAGMVAGTQGWNSRMGWATGWKGAGVLAFAPSAALDAYQSYHAEAGSGGRTFHGEEFLIRSAKSQSGNAVGLAASVAFGAAAVAIGIAGAPVILIGLGMGIIFQIAWGAAGGSDWAEEQARRALK